jgi:hypothetical protein
LKPGSHDDRSDFNCFSVGSLIVLDRAPLTDLLAYLAFPLRKVSAVLLIDYIRRGNGLRKRDIDGFSRSHVAVEFIFNFNRAFRCAVTAPDAFLLIHVSGLPPHLDPEIPYLPFNLLNLRQTQDLDVFTFCDFNHFR